MSDSRVNIGRAMLVGVALLAVSTLLVFMSMSAAQVPTPSPGPTKEIQVPAQQQTIGPSTKTASDSGQGTARNGWMRWVKSNANELTLLFTGVVALFTVVLAVVGCLQWRIYRQIHRSNKVVERAYVALSHTHPGLQPFPAGAQTAKVEVRVRNHGNTPADVTAISLRLWTTAAPLPKVPDDVYAAAQQITAFLTARDKFFTLFTRICTNACRDAGAEK